jgi:uncharacterized protein
MLFITLILRNAFTRLAFGPAVLIVTGAAAAAGIDCDKATTRTEAAICASQELMKLDQELDLAYHNLLDSNPADTLNRGFQRTWLVTRDAGCRGNRACLIATYEDRIAELKQLTRANAALDGI